MRRATVTLSDDLDRRLVEFTHAQVGRPTFTSIVEAALDAYLGGPAHGVSSRIVTVVRHRESIVAAARRAGASRVGVFGSVARGEDGEDSDIDFWVEGGPELTLFTMAALREELGHLTGAGIDLVTLESIPPETRATVLAESVML